MFTNLDDYENDTIEGMFARLAADDCTDKIDLGIGVYRDASGAAPVMQSVRLAEQQLISRKGPKSYLSPLGNRDYCADIEHLVLGPDHPVLAESRVVSAQTPGAGSALRAGAEFVHGLSPNASVWASRPVWGHQMEFFAKAGLAVKSYRYYDQQNSQQEFAAMLENLEGMQPGDLLLLHGCCHNPTGQDLDVEQWLQVADVVVRKGVVPFVDVAYQGFGTGLDEDVAGLRAFAERVPEMLLAVSSSKTFGIYRDRAGLLSVILPPGARQKVNVTRRLRDTVRQLYFMAPDHGAATVHELLSTPDLERLWRTEIAAIQQYVIRMRDQLKDAIEATVAGYDASWLLQQKGMFSCLPISSEEQRFLEQQYHIYMLPPARINVAAMNSKQSVILAKAFQAIRQQSAQQEGMSAKVS